MSSTPDRARDADSPPPNKRPRMGIEQASTEAQSNGNVDRNAPSAPSLPPLSLSILGTEPTDEFILEIADFVYRAIVNRPEPGRIEVEAKIGILNDNHTGRRILLPVGSETSMSICLDAFKIGFPL